MLPDGIEPPSQRLKGARSATELEKHDLPTYPSGRLGSTQGHLSVGRNLCPVLPDPGNWPTATECSCGLVVGCGLSSSTHELGSAWHQCRQRDARAGFEPAFSRGCWPCGIPLPHPALCPDISRRGGKENARGSLWDSRAAVWEVRPLFGLPFPHVSIYQTTALHSILRYGFFVPSSHVAEPEGGDLPPKRFDFSVGFDDSPLVPL